MKAAPAQQQTLLQVQDLDVHLAQLAYSARSLPVLAELAELQQRAAELDDRLVTARTEVADVQATVSRAESDVQVVRERAARDQARLDAGIGSAKDMQALQHELESLAHRQSDLEDAELEIMERLEALEGAADELARERGDLDEQIRAAQAVRDEALAQIHQEEHSVAQQRAALLPQVGDELLALYEKIRAGAGGVGAALLRARRCGGCRLELNPADVARFGQAAADEVLRCEECRRILVRTDESGL